MMRTVRRSTVYFERAGPLNTTSLLDAVSERLGLKDVRIVVVPVTTGRTAELFTSRLRNEAEIVTVSEDEAVSACRRVAYTEGGLLEKLVGKRLGKTLGKVESSQRREIFDLTFLPFCGEKWNLVSEPFYAFGQGMKVAVEVSVAAVEIGKVKPYTDVVAVGGTGEGADTAIIVRTSTQGEAFGSRPDRRLSVREVVAMPIEKW